LSQISLSAPFYFAGALAAANAVLIFFLLPESLPAPDDAAPASHSFAVFSQGFGSVIVPLMAAYFFMMIGFSILTSFFAIFTEDRFGYNAHANGYIFACIGVIGLVVQGAMIGPLVKNFTEKRIAIIGLALLACSMFALPLAHTVTILLLVTAGFAVGNGFVNPTINGLVSRCVDKHRQGRVLGLMQASASLGRFIGPLLGGWLVAFNARRTLDFGRAPFWTGGVLLIISLLVTTMVSVRQKNEPEEGLPEKA
jgi:predicted MFS family arabinose efflux permease